MRKIKHTVFTLLAVLPIVVFLLDFYYGLKIGTEGMTFISSVQSVLGDFGSFFAPIISPVLLGFVELTDSLGVANFSWIIGYYIVLLFINLIWSLFTFLITMFMDKIDIMRGRK